MITVFTIINVICIVGLNVCAYSAYINPASHPNFSILGMAFPVFLIATGFFIFFWMIFKPKFMLISIVGMLLCAGSVRTYCPVNFFKSDAPEGSLKVMSFNICHLEWGNSDEIDKNDPLYCIPSAKHTLLWNIWRTATLISSVAKKHRIWTKPKSREVQTLNSGRPTTPR